MQEQFVVGLLLLWGLQCGLFVCLHQRLQVAGQLHRLCHFGRGGRCFQQERGHISQDKVLDLLRKQKVQISVLLLPVYKQRDHFMR